MVVSVVAASPVAAQGAQCFGITATVQSNAALVEGTPGNDVIVGGPADQEIRGLGGNDVILSLIHI